MSYATITTGNLELTPMRVTYKGVDLGATLDNVVITPKISTSNINADQMGTTVIDRRVSGYDISITTSLAEVLLKDNWEVIFPYASLIDSGGNKQMYFDSQIGASALAAAGVLVLHPLSKTDSDLSGDYKFWKVTAQPESEITYSPTGQAKMKVTFQVYPDFTSAPARFFVYGDPSIGLVAASASGATFTGTGGGSIGSISASSGAATEVVTIKCVGAVSGAGNFSVVGSQSGNIGLAVVGVAFTSTKINFTLTDGAPDFALNDQYVLSTVSANYV
jgi:hypothetical protein